MVVPEAVKVCEPEGNFTTALETLLGPCRNGDDAADDVKSETITPQDDDESAISTEHNLDPAMQQLVNSSMPSLNSPLYIRSREASHRIAQLELGLASCILHAIFY
jgi:hypothetical protein